jgi:hypothetical protein
MDDVLAQLFGALRDERDAMRGRTSGRIARTPAPGVPAVPAGRFETGPVRTDSGEGAAIREPGDVRFGPELTPPELTPAPREVPAAIQAMANQLAQSRPITEPEPEAEPEPERPKRATTKDEDDHEDDQVASGGNGTPVPITDSDTGPSGPVRLPGRSR